MPLHPLTTTFNRNHPIGSTVEIKGLEGRKTITGAAYVSEQGTVLASFTGALQGASVNGGTGREFAMKVLFDIKTVK